MWGTDVWEGFTNKNGTGFYHELMTQLFSDSQYQLTVSYFPWKRSLMYLEKDAIDMTGAMPATNKFYMSSAPVLSETIYAVYLTKNKSICCDFNSKLGSYRSGYEKDLFKHAMPNAVKAVDVKDAHEGIKLVLSGKVDYFVDVGSILSSTIARDSQAGLSKKAVGSFPLYWAFAKTSKGKLLKTHFDGRIKQLKKSGELLKLYSSYQLIMPK